jgi:hypothetical protein
MSNLQNQEQWQSLIFIVFVLFIKIIDNLLQINIFSNYQKEPNFSNNYSLQQ